MLFNSLQFAVFLPVVFAVYWLLRHHLRWQNLFVLTASYLFYGWWDWRFLILIVFTSGCSFLSGLWVHRYRWLLWANIIVNLLVLGVFKYYDFFVGSFASLFPALGADRWLLNLVLPVGISFYTFQALSYTIDVHRGDIKPSRDIVVFFAYVAFFPQLVAGPIERATSLLPQFDRERHFDFSQAVDGLRQMLWGFFKKLVVADGCAIYVDRVFDSADTFAGPTLIVAVVLFTFQIYADFSGYSDIAIGTAKLFGITLRRNFDVPYFSRDIAEHWRRWHISLTTWFRDYVYIPLGGSRVGVGRKVVNTFVIFLLSGLWHGASWNYVAWGAYHAMLFLPLILLGRNRRYRDTVAAGRLLPSPADLLRMLTTFMFVVLGFVIFRNPTLGDAVNYMACLFRGGGEWLNPLDEQWYLMVLWVAVMIVVEWFNRERQHGFSRQPRNTVVRWLGYMVLIFIIVAFMQTKELPFIYFQF